MLEGIFDQRPEERLAAKLTVVLWTAVLLFVAITTLLLGTPSIGDMISLLSGTATAIGVAVLLHRAFRALMGRPQWLAWPGVVVAVLGATTLQTAADYGGQFVLDRVFDDFQLPPYDRSTLMRVGIVYFALYLCNLALFWLSFTSEQARVVEVRAVRAELARLRSQLDPHFMSNSLNAISSLIVTGQYEAANAVTEQLADFLRDVIHAGDEVERPLREELELVSAYLGVERVRFGDRLELTLDCPDPLQEALAPSFILQPLVENAIKHSVSQTSRPVSLNIRAETDDGHLLLTVEENGPGTARTGRTSGGIGLANTRARLELLHGPAASLETESLSPGFRTTLRLPLRFSEVVAAP